MLHSIYDLTTFCRQTSGDVPSKLVGASTTVIGSKMYLFGGRLVSERRMVSDLYVFDLDTFVWEMLPAHPDDDTPRPRYFHSTDAWNNHLVVFGGMSNKPDSINPDDLCVLNDVRFYSLATRRWLPPVDFPSSAEQFIPRARYAHLSSVTADRLFIIGGQDFFNAWLDDVCVFDLATKTWIQRRDYPRHCGTYRSVAVCSNTAIRYPQDEIQTTQASSSLGPPGSRFTTPAPSTSPSDSVTPSQKLVHLPYSVAPTEDHPSDIYLYSNYNFTDVKRELEIFSPLPDGDFTIQDRSSAMTGTTFPPGLRFPTGALLGSHLIIAGTYLAHSYQSFSIWVLDLTSMTWSRIDCGKAIETGSWFRGCLHPDANKFVIFGNKHGNLVDDYNRRLLSWDHVAVVDLAAFGIYQPPPLKLDVRMQEIGLAALEERVLVDFEIVCDDGQRIPCSRRMLEDRWPWFKEQRKQFLKKAKSVLEGLPSSAMHVPLPDLSGAHPTEEPRVDPRLTPRAFHLSEPYPVTMALLQYFYSLALITPLQHSPPVLSQLLILATNYRITHLERLVQHAMHRSLSNSTSVGVYEVATLCSCRSLQIRALKTVMSYTQRRPPKRSDKDSSGNAKHSDGGDGRDGGSTKYVSRPRGTSDAKWRNMPDSGASSSGYNAQSASTAQEQQRQHARAGSSSATIESGTAPAQQGSAPTSLAALGSLSHSATLSPSTTPVSAAATPAVLVSTNSTLGTNPATVHPASTQRDAPSTVITPPAGLDQPISINPSIPSSASKAQVIAPVPEDVDIDTTGYGTTTTVPSNASTSPPLRHASTPVPNPSPPGGTTSPSPITVQPSIITNPSPGITALPSNSTTSIQTQPTYAPVLASQVSTSSTATPQSAAPTIPSYSKSPIKRGTPLLKRPVTADSYNPPRSFGFFGGGGLVGGLSLLGGSKQRQRPGATQGPTTPTSPSFLPYLNENEEDGRSPSDREFYTRSPGGAATNTATSVGVAPSHVPATDSSAPTQGTAPLTPFSRTRTGSGPTAATTTTNGGGTSQYPRAPLSSSGGSVWSENTTLLSPSQSDGSLRESQITVVESELGTTTDDEYQVLTKEDIPVSGSLASGGGGSSSGGSKAESVYSDKSGSSGGGSGSGGGMSFQKFGLGGWPSRQANAPSTVRWLEREVNPESKLALAASSTPSPPIAAGSIVGNAPPVTFPTANSSLYGGSGVGSSPARPGTAPASASGSSGFARFLSRSRDKHHQPPHHAPSLPSTSEDERPMSTAAGSGPPKTLVEIKAQIAQLEEEQKRLKKEAKIRALLSQTGGSVSVLGGGMMM